MDKLLAYIREDFERELKNTKFPGHIMIPLETIMALFDKASLKSLYRWARERGINLD